MKTITEPLTSVRLYESGSIRTITDEVLVKEAAHDDHRNDVRLTETGPYRIVMHCQNKIGKRTENTRKP